MKEPNDRHDPPAGLRERRFLVIVVSCVAALSLLVGVALVAAWQAGSIVVQVHETGRGGDNVELRVPAALGHLAVLCLPDKAFASTSGRCCLSCSRMKPLARALELVPDGTVLVQVDSPRETVRIAREHGILLIHVDSAEGNVRVELPVKLAGAFLKRAAA
jgi:hypothetical protein